MTSLANKQPVVDLGVEVKPLVNFKDPTIYGSKQAILLGMQGEFTGLDSEKNKIKPSGSGRNEGKFLLGDIKKCPTVQEWIAKNNKGNNNEVKKKKDFSGKKAKEAFEKLGITVKEYDELKGGRSGVRTANSITCKDIKEFLKAGKVDVNKVVVDEDKMFTTKKMKARIDELGTNSRKKAMAYLNENKGTYKSKKWWGKKEIDAAIKQLNKD